MAFGLALPTWARLSQRVLDEQWADAAFAARGIETAEQWWDALALEPAFAPLLPERAERFAGKQRQEAPPGFDVHVAALRDRLARRSPIRRRAALSTGAPARRPEASPEANRQGAPLAWRAVAPVRTKVVPT
jgi:hypothetical protein